jgi:hypothetical protein
MNTDDYERDDKPINGTIDTIDAVHTARQCQIPFYFHATLMDYSECVFTHQQTPAPSDATLHLVRILSPLRYAIPKFEHPTPAEPHAIYVRLF